MNKNHFILVLLVVTILGSSCSQKIATSQSNGLVFEALTCNSKNNPTMVESEHPLFSWVVSAQGFNKSQSAYHILVASSIDELNENKADLWNSEKKISSKSVHVKYEGKSIKPLKKYFWKVKIWDEKDQVSKWSEPQTFQMGLLNEANWGESQWISLNKDTRTSNHRFRDYQTGGMNEPLLVEGQPASYFRNSINTEKEIQSAQAFICGLGYYELYLNGKKVGDHVLDPAPSNYDKQAYYVSYDLSEYLNKGKNAIGIVLGNGFYGQDISWKNNPESDKDLSYGAPAVRLLIKLTYNDGSHEDFYTDKNWKESTGPIVFNNIYGGDTYDARFEINGWDTVGYDDSTWGVAKVVSPEVTKISAQQIPPIRKLKEFEPQNIFKAPDGDWIVDFGQNIAGWVNINVQEKEGQLIEITTTEALLRNGKDVFSGSTGGGANGMAQIYKYICKGSGKESWEPKFSYHGFRYAKIKGFSRKTD